MGVGTLRTTLIAGVLTIAAVTVVGGCSANGDAEPRALGDDVAATDSGPCRLLEPSEIDRATGWSVAAGTAPEDPVAGVAFCHFEDDHRRGVVQIAIDDDGTAAFDAAQEAALAGDGPGVTDADVPGASETFQVAATGQVAMVVDGRFVEVSTVGIGVPDGAHLELAKLAAERA